MALRVYESEQPLSQSAHATVFRGDFKTDIVAVKRLRHGDIEVFEREIRQLKHLDHDNLILYKAAFRNRDGTIDVVMRIGELDSMKEALRDHTHTLEWKFSMFYQIASALSYLHEHGIVHGNLNLGNILFQDLVHGRALVGNYCKSIRQRSPPKSVEDQMFEPPEKTSSKQGDVYSYSLIVVCILVHAVPKNRDQLSNMQLAVATQSSLSTAKTFSKLLKRGLSKDLGERPTMALFANTFDLGLPEQTFRAQRGDRMSDEVFKIIVMGITCATLAIFACYAPGLNELLDQFNGKPDLDQD